MRNPYFMPCARTCAPIGFVSTRGRDRRKLACGVVVAVLSFATWAETYTWTGGSGNWEDGAHWISSQSTTGTVPGAGDKAVLPAVAGGCTILVNQSFSVESIDIGDKNNAGGTVKLSFNHNLVNTVSGDIHVYKGATLTHEALSSTADTLAEGNRRVWIEADGDILIEKDSLVEADAKGYDISKGPGGNNGYCGGGFHATLGQKADGNTLAATEDGPRGVYGSFRCPTTHGSGGTGANGRGGGVIRLKALGTLRLDGVVRANGYLTASYGPGAGGSAWLTAGTISGAGSVSAYSPFYNGGGGRISLVQTAATDWTAFTGTIVTVSTSVENRIAPSIYLESAADAPGRGELRVTGCRNNGYPILFAPRVTDAEEPFGTVAVKTYGKVEVRSGMTLRVTKAVSAGGSSFASGEGTVELMPAAGETMTVSGTLEMKHLVITNAGGTVSFAKNCTVKSADDGTLKLAGTAAAPLTLTGTNGTWKLTVGAHVDADVSHVSVSNCNSSAGAAIADVCGTGLGGTANWYFTRPAQAGDPLVWTGAGGNTDWQNAGN